MYVDKKLEGVNAVQTLARLNRIHPGKPLPFVPDFRNEADAIADAFRPWYNTTISEPVDANTLYTFQGNLQSAGVFTTSEVDHYWAVFADTAPNERKGNGALYAALEAPLGRFNDDLDDGACEQFRSDLDAYVRCYSFLSQVATWTDADLEKLYVIAKSLEAVLPRRPNDGAMDLGSEVELTHLRIEKQGDFNSSLIADADGADPLVVYPGGGSAGTGDPEKDWLSAIVNRLNEKHGLSLSLTDALLFEQFKDDWTGDPEIQAAAKANDLDNFMIVFTKQFMNVVLSRMDANADIFKAILDDDAFAKDLQISYGRDVYRELTEEQGDAT